MQSPERGRIDGKSTQRGQRTMLFPVHLLAPSACHQAVPHQGAFLKGQWKQNQSGEVKLVILEGLPANIRKKGVQQRSTTQNWPQWTTDLSLVAELWEKTGNMDIQGGEAGIFRHPLVPAISWKQPLRTISQCCGLSFKQRVMVQWPEHLRRKTQMLAVEFGPWTTESLGGYGE